MHAAKHVDDINMASPEDTIDKHVKCVEDTFGKCKLNKYTYTNCAVIYTMDDDGNVTLDQNEYIQQRRPIQRPELTGADADAQVTNMVADMVVSHRERVQEPTNIHVRRLSAITRKLQACPKKIVYRAMNPTGEVDSHSDSGSRRLSGDADDVKGYGIRGANLLRRGNTSPGKPVVRLIDAHCKSRRLQ
eukprot:8040720-Pyramimonas_sp.AAC.1